VSDPNDEPLDLSSWDAQAPPADFAERVLARVREEAPPVKKARRRWPIAAGAVATLSLAAAIAIGVGRAPSHGDAIAAERTEVSVGSRARAVLEPGAHVTWDGDEVTQPSGDVFYRVEPGARFRVHTPAGDVEVKGTCFTVKVIDMQKRDVKSGAVGALLSAIAFVGVYEGKVAVSHASERQDLVAGEGAQIGADGVKKSSLADGQKAFDAKAAEAKNDDALASANSNLTDQVSEYRKRLELVAEQKADLERKLKATEEKLASRTDGGRTRAEYDLDKDDWAELAKSGQVKFRVPCFREEGWNFPADKLNKLGLAPSDGPTMKDAYQRSRDRIWKEMRPMCVTALGVSSDNGVVDILGPDTCMHVIYEQAAKSDREGASEAHTETAEIYAGMRARPGPNEKIHPVMKLFTLLIDANKNFENDLAKSFGPDEAHRLAFSDDMCSSNSRWGGGKKRE